MGDAPVPDVAQR